MNAELEKQVDDRSDKLAKIYAVLTAARKTVEQFRRMASRKVSMDTVELAAVCELLEETLDDLDGKPPRVKPVQAGQPVNFTLEGE